MDGRVKDVANQFQRVLEDINREGGFSWSLLVTEEGLPIAWAPGVSEVENASAMVALLGRVSTRIRKELALGTLEEITIRTADRDLLVCWPVELGKDVIILGVLVPPDTSYRRVANRAVARIRALVV